MSKIIKQANQYIARGFMVAVFTSFYYTDRTFAFFAGVLWILMIYSLVYLKVKQKAWMYGAVLGMISAAGGYFLATLFV